MESDQRLETGTLISNQTDQPHTMYPKKNQTLYQIINLNHCQLTNLNQLGGPRHDHHGCKLHLDSQISTPRFSTTLAENAPDLDF